MAIKMQRFPKLRGVFRLPVRAVFVGKVTPRLTSADREKLDSFQSSPSPNRISNTSATVTFSGHLVGAACEASSVIISCHHRHHLLWWCWWWCLYLHCCCLLFVVGAFLLVLVTAAETLVLLRCNARTPACMSRERV